MRQGAPLLWISAALLAYELLLMRLLSLAWAGQFAGFTISVAMLGFALAGIVLHLLRERVSADPGRWMALAAGVFAVLGPLAFEVSQRLPFAPFMLIVSSAEFGALALRVLVFALPFVAAGIAVGVPFVAREQATPRLYALTMAGSALPALPLLALMSYVHPAWLLPPIAGLGLFAAHLAGLRARGVALALFVIALCAAQPFRYSEYKELSRTLLLPEAQMVEEVPGPDALAQRLDSPRTRWLPGLSLGFTGELPPAQFVFTDGAAMDVLFDLRQIGSQAESMAASPEAFAYRLRKRPHTLLLRAPATEIARALSFGARNVVALEESAARTRLLRDWLATDPRGARVELEQDEPRQFLATHPQRWGLIQLSLYGVEGASFTPMPLFTREGFDALWARLDEEGILSIAAWVENPPRSGTRLAAWVADGLRRHGIAEPARHVLAIRGWSTLAVFVSKQPCGDEAVRKLLEFTEPLSFDAVHFPGIRAEEANRSNVIPDAPYYTAFATLLAGPASDYLARSAWQLDVPDDDRPFFAHNFQWRALPELLQRFGRDWLPYVDVAYVLQCAALLAAAVLGLALLVPPVLAVAAVPAARSLLLFFCLGFGYMAVELWAIHRLSLFLSHWYVAAAVTLSSMLIASGVGALLLASRGRGRLWCFVLVIALACLFASYGVLHRVAFGEPLWLRIALACLWLAPAALLMGFPYPYALARLAPAEVPWALAINGFGSVLGGLAANLLAVDFGLRVLGLAALFLYAIAALCLQPLLVVRRPGGEA